MQKKTEDGNEKNPKRIRNQLRMEIRAGHHTTPALLGRTYVLFFTVASSFIVACVLHRKDVLTRLAINHGWLAGWLAVALALPRNSVLCCDDCPTRERPDNIYDRWWRWRRPVFWTHIERREHYLHS